MMRFLFFLFLNVAQINSQQLVSYRFDELEGFQKKQTKKVLIQVFTNWCFVCKIDIQSLKNNVRLLGLINEQTYFVRFNPETFKNDIAFNNKKFKYISNGNTGLHSLVFALSKNKNQSIYPLWILLDEKNNLLFYNEGKLNQEKLDAVFEKEIPLNN